MPEVADRSYLTTKGIRNPSLKPVVKMKSFTHTCNSCHQNFESPPNDKPQTQRRLLAEHGDIVLAHGDNRHCLNCHHTKNREAFTNHVGIEIPYNKSEQLCAKCHGPKYRDWKLGVHGRRNGYWDESRGPTVRLTCTSMNGSIKDGMARARTPPSSTLSTWWGWIKTSSADLGRSSNHS